MIVGGDLGGYYSWPPGKVGDVGLLVTSKGDASGTGVRSGTGLGGGALEVDLSSG